MEQGLKQWGGGLGGGSDGGKEVRGGGTRETVFRFWRTQVSVRGG